MIFDWFRGIIHINKLTSEKYNKDWQQLEQWWNDHDSGIRSWTRLNSSGSLNLPSTTVTSNYTAGDSDYLVIGNPSSTLTITLPDSSSRKGRQYLIFNTGTKNLLVNTTSSQTINGGLSITVPPNYFHVQLFSDGSNWLAI